MTSLIFLYIILIYFSGGTCTKNGSSDLSCNDFCNVSLSRRVRAVKNELIPPTIVEEMSPVIFVDKRPVVVRCGVTGQPAPTVKWYEEKGDTPELVTSGRGVIVQNDGSLELSKNSAQHISTGPYFCSASNYLGTVISRKFHAKKKVSIDNAVIRYKYKNSGVGDKAVVECRSSPEYVTPLMTLKMWEVQLVDGKLLTLNTTVDRFSVITYTKNPQLHIRNMTNADFSSLKVRCVLWPRIRNSVSISSSLSSSPDSGHQIKGIWLTLESQSSVYIQYLPPYTVCEGERFTITKDDTVELPWCGSSSISQAGTTQQRNPPLAWYVVKKGTIENRTRIPLQRHKSGTGSGRGTEAAGGSEGRFSLAGPLMPGRFDNLCIRKVRVEDEGVYLVQRAKQPLLEKTRFTLKVVEPLLVNVLPGKSLIPYGNQLKIYCMAQGRPMTHVYWLHNGRRLRSEAPTAADSTSRVTYHLVINEVNITTAGVYQCVVESMEPPGVVLDAAQGYATVLIKVMPPLLVKQHPLVDKELPYSILTLAPGSSSGGKSETRFSCVFSAVPAVNITWYLDERPLPMHEAVYVDVQLDPPYSRSSQITIDSTKLALGEEWRMGGEYRAVASNSGDSGGTAFCRVMVYVKGVLRIRSPKKTIFFQGDPMVLRCNVVSASRPDIQWFIKRGNKLVRLPETHKEQESVDKRSLTVAKVDKHVYEGNYTCAAVVDQKARQEMTWHVSVVRRPSIAQVLPKRINVQQQLSSRGSFLCRPDENTDTPWFAWWTVRHHESSGVSEYKVIHPRNGKKSYVDGVKIQYSKFMRSPVSEPVLSLPKGVPGFLRKYANIPVKIWIKYDERFDEANISCIVRNNAGFDERKIPIHIINTKFRIQPPSSMKVLLGQSFHIDCVPEPSAKLHMTTRWRYTEKSSSTYKEVSLEASLEANLGGARGPGDGKQQLIYQAHNNSLIVRHITQSATLHFTCIVKIKDPPNAFSKVTKVTVQVPARIVDFPSTVDLRRSKDAEIACRVHGDLDQMVVKWEYVDSFWKKNVNSMSQTSNKQAKITSRILKISRVTDDSQGVYHCTASNIFTTTKATATVTVFVVDVPGPVVRAEAIVESARSVWLSWVVPEYTGKKNITSYKVDCRLIDNNEDSSNSTVSIVSNETSLLVESLRPASRYRLSVRATNPVGDGAISTLEDIVTLEAVPEGAVSHLQVAADSATKLVVSWQPPPPQLRNGRILLYVVCIVPYHKSLLLSPGSANHTTAAISEMWEDLKQAQCNKVEASSSLQHNFTELAKFAEYEVRVVANNSVGSGPAKYGRGRTKEAPPGGAPSGLRCNPDSAGLTMEWNPPAKASINGVLIGYRVVYFTATEPQTDKVTSQPRLVLIGLRPYTVYSVQVLCYNSHGPGPLSAPVSCTTNQAAPSAPAGAKAFFSRRDVISVSWLPPRSPNGPVSKYCLTLQAHAKQHKPHCVPDQQDQQGRAYMTTNLSGIGESGSLTVKIVSYNMLEGASIEVPIEPYENLGGVVSVSRNLSVEEGTRITLDCETSPERPSQAGWIEKASRPDSTQTLDNNSLVLEAATTQDAGHYRCSFDAGSADPVSGHRVVDYWLHVYVVRKGVPDQPKIYYHTVTQSSVLVSWRRGSPSPVSGFILNFTATDTGIGCRSRVLRQQHVDGLQHSFNKTDLCCATDYIVSLAAKNSIGQSPWEIVKLRTNGLKPLQVCNLTVRAYSKSLCFPLVGFDPGPGCPLESFHFSLSPTHASGRLDFSTSDTLNHSVPATAASDSCYNISQLNPATQYNWRLEARNAAGASRIKGTYRTLSHSTPMPPDSQSSSSSSSAGGPVLKKKHDSTVSQKTLIGSVMFGAVFILVLLLICVLLLRRHRRKSRYLCSKADTVAAGPSIRNQIQQPRHKQQQQPMSGGSSAATGNVAGSSSVARASSAGGNHQRHQISLPPTPYDEDSELLEPYATYATTAEHLHQPNSSLPGRGGGSGGQITTNLLTQTPSRTLRAGPSLPQQQQQLQRGGGGQYSHGSQTHSYQYPDVPSSAPLLSNTAVAPSTPFLMRSQQQRYDMGYSMGATGPPGSNNKEVASQQQQQHQQQSQPLQAAYVAESESSYRPSSSTTASSAKDELANFLPTDVSAVSCLSVLDGGRSSTLQGPSSSVSTLAGLMQVPSSVGPLNFTAAPPSSLATIRPHAAPSTGPLVHQLHPQSQQLMTAVSEEDDESNNYTNQFILV